MRMLTFGAAVVLITAGCSKESGTAGWTVEEGSGEETSYGDPGVVVISPGSGEETIITGSGDGCVELQGDVCIDPSDVRNENCDDPNAQADIILDSDGKVIDVVCYPPADSGTPLDEVAADGEVPQNENGAVIVFDHATDGEPIEGDVRLSAERVTLYGNGPDSTILDGNLVIESNNSTARGFTATGDVSFTKNSNNASLVFCRVQGSLDVAANDVTVANCQVFGDVNVTGNGATLINIGVQGAWNVDDSAYCDGCYSISDDNADFVVADDEVGDPLECGGSRS